MIQVFCNERGAGKTKNLIELANEQLKIAKGVSVYIDDDCSYIRQVDRRIRFIATKEYRIIDEDSFYGLLCGIICGNYDIENIYIDGMFNLINRNNDKLAIFFIKINELAEKYNLNMYININFESKLLPEFIKKYVA